MVLLTWSQATLAQEFEITANRVASKIVIDVQADINAPIDLVWAVFSDYEHTPCFVKSVLSSHASPLGPDELLVERVGILDLGLFSLHLGAKYRVQQEPRQYRLQSQLVSGDAKSMHHTMQLTSVGAEHTTLSSHAVIEPPSWFPTQWSQALMMRQARASFQDMLNEVHKRASTHEASTCSKS
mgnify:CR=1 FL=1